MDRNIAFTCLGTAILLSLSVVASAADSIDFRIVKAQTGGLYDGTETCKISAEVTNSTSQTLGFLVDFQAYDSNGYLIGTAEWYFLNLRPEKRQVYEYVLKQASCDEVELLELNSVRNCQVNGDFRNTCIALIALSEGNALPVKL